MLPPMPRPKILKANWDDTGPIRVSLDADYMYIIEARHLITHQTWKAEL